MAVDPTMPPEVTETHMSFHSFAPRGPPIASTHMPLLGLAALTQDTIKIVSRVKVADAPVLSRSAIYQQSRRATFDAEVEIRADAFVHPRLAPIDAPPVGVAVLIFDTNLVTYARVWIGGCHVFRAKIYSIFIVANWPVTKYAGN